eukprot:XP_001709827.1 Hypothetical protein GL50803_119070 [Giardia lamblia ATCC 50803]
MRTHRDPHSFDVWENAGADHSKVVHLMSWFPIAGITRKCPPVIHNFMPAHLRVKHPCLACQSIHDGSRCVSIPYHRPLCCCTVRVLLVALLADALHKAMFPWQ